MRTMIVSLSLLAAMTLTGCEGPEGPAGAPGVDGAAGIDGEDGAAGAAGAAGADGEDLTAPPPDDVVFSMAVTNASGGTHKGKKALKLTFDGTTTSSDEVVSTFLDMPPMINGKDGGKTAEWGDFESSVTFDTTAGTDNGTTGATVRSGYDDEFIYFFVQWDEDSSHAGFGETYQRKMWTYDLTGDAWTQGSGGEDRVFLMFPITPIADWATQGCTTACHGSVMHTANAGELLDVWHYKHARTGPTNTADDKWWDHTDRKSDPGTSAYVEPKNAAGDGPAYMYAADPGANMDYPVNVWEMVPFVDAGWADGDPIPGVINRTPEGSRGDVTAVCDFVSPTWTCEFKRDRYTGNGDDYQF